MTTITVSNVTQLQSALTAASPGDTIALTPGTYTGVDVYNINKASPYITITSSDPTNKAILTNFNINISSGLIFQALAFNMLVPNYTGYNVYSSQYITFTTSHFYGPAGAPVTPGSMLNFFDCDHLTLTNNVGEQADHIFSVARSTNILISGNHLHHVNSDTLDFNQVQHLTVSGNALHDFYPTDGNHPDAMQFEASSPYAASDDITITDNLIYKGQGQGSQGIFMSDETGVLPFTNTVISDNLFVDFAGYSIRPTHNTTLALTNNELVSVTGHDPSLVLVEYSDQVTSTNNKSTIAISFHADTNVTSTGDTITATVDQATADARIAQWFTDHPDGAWGSGPVSPPPPPPPPPLTADATRVIALKNLMSKIQLEAQSGIKDNKNNKNHWFNAIILETTKAPSI